MNKILLFIVLLLFISCGSKAEENKSIKSKENLEMYIPSELALLMEEMYLYNDSIKKGIEKGIIPNQEYPDRFLQIHTAEMTHTFERDESFKKYAESFIYMQNEISNSNADNIRENYNNAINLCIGCHRTSCTGPIPRIEKLLIKK